MPVHELPSIVLLRVREAERDGVDFNLAFIPASFKALHREEFDTDYMRVLFQTGYDLAVKGYPWEKRPPGFRCRSNSDRFHQRRECVLNSRRVKPCQ